MNPLVTAALVKGGSSAFGQVMANKANKAASMRQMSFQREMSSTAYQRAMADMRKAGLNPILAYKQGPASSPAGSTYQAGNVGLAGAQGAQAFSTAENLQTAKAIADTTLEMLKKNNISMAEVQYTAKNVFGSKMLRTFEAALGGNVKDAPGGAYRELASKIKEYIKDHQAGLGKNYNPDAPPHRKAAGKQFSIGSQGQLEPTLQLSGEAFGNLLGMIPGWIAELGLEAGGELKSDIYNLILKGLGK